MLARLVDETAALLGVESPSLGHVRIDDGTLGPGYGVPTELVWAAVRLFGRTEGVVLEPVYNGKSAATLVERAGRGEFGADEHVVFVHTGGLPGLYGYGPEAAVGAAG
jgi:D-cysteine desulfhydrase